MFLDMTAGTSQSLVTQTYVGPEYGVIARDTPYMVKIGALGHGSGNGHFRSLKAGQPVWFPAPVPQDSPPRCTKASRASPRAWDLYASPRKNPLVHKCRFRFAITFPPNNRPIHATGTYQSSSSFSISSSYRKDQEDSRLRFRQVRRYESLRIHPSP